MFFKFFSEISGFLTIFRKFLVNFWKNTVFAIFDIFVIFLDFLHSGNWNDLPETPSGGGGSSRYSTTCIFDPPKNGYPILGRLLDQKLGPNWIKSFYPLRWFFVKIGGPKMTHFLDQKRSFLDPLQKVRFFDFFKNLTEGVKFLHFFSLFFSFCIF